MRLADDKTISKTAYMIDITVNGIVELRGYFAPVMPRNLVGRRLIDHKKWILDNVKYELCYLRNYGVPNRKLSYKKA
ncbi:MAG: hypothetical protein ACE5KT_09330 [Methanosarcinales archaeon]